MSPVNNTDQEVTQVRTNSSDPEVQETRSATARSNTVPGQVLAARVVQFIGGILISLLAIRFVLALLGANRDNAFADMIFGLSYPFVAPFFGLFGIEPTYGRTVLELSTLVAMLVYALIFWGLSRLFTLNRRNPEAV